MKIFTSFLLLFICIQPAIAQENPLHNSNIVEFPQITLINSIRFQDGALAPSYPGCSFLIDIGDDTLAVTCKHSLWTGKNDSITGISLAGQVKEWRMFVKNDSSNYVVVDKMINENTDELISEWNTETDFLVFTIKENHSTVKPLKLNALRLEKGDDLYKVGWAFKDKDCPQQVYKSKFYKYSGNAMLVEDEVRENQAGTSGSPVLTDDGMLAGIVSSWKYDPESLNWYPAPCSTDYLWEVIYRYRLSKYNKEISTETYLEFKKEYESKNDCIVELSDNFFINVFFNSWLVDKKIKYGTEDDFNSWRKQAEGFLKKKIKLPESRKDELILNSWIIDYEAGRKGLVELGKMISGDEVLIDYISLCKYAMNLALGQKNREALSIMDFTVKAFPNNGQVYYYLGEVYRAIGDGENTIASYNKCLELYPGYPFAVEKLKPLVQNQQIN